MSVMLCFSDRQQGPILIECSNGVDQCGMFVAICNTLEKMQIDRCVDVAFAVKKVRQCRRKAITTYKDYQTLHETIAAVIVEQDEYEYTAL